MKTFIIRLTCMIGLCLCMVISLKAQYPDNNWLLGYSYLPSGADSFGLVQLNFAKNQLSIGEETELLYRFRNHNSLISDIDGEEILFFYNGLQIRDGSTYELIENGDSMYIGTYSSGYDIPQGSLILPWPDQENEKYLLLNTYLEVTTTIIGYELNFSIIEVDEMNRATVIEKNQPLEIGILHTGQLTATRHANGRDWWIIWPYRDSNRYIRFLFTPDGLERQEDQYLSQPIRSGLGRSCFSPDGRFFAMFNGISNTEGNFFDLYDFDRCAGLLSNHRQYSPHRSAGGGGGAFSHDSRYLYLSYSLHVFQFDLYADDIYESLDTVVVWDGGLDPFPTTFNQSQLARDGKIYLSAANSMTKLHVIDYPNRRGTACNVRQRGIELPVHISFGLPNFPNHRLGPLDGSPCDTLGIDNVPLASFRSDQSEEDYRHFFFQDLSTYEPATWSWSFGDGSVSQDTSPVHTYAQDGVYEVCLTVSNEYGTDTSCDTLYLGVVNSTEATAPKVEWQLFPNPAQNYFTFNLLDYYPRNAYLELYNSMGQRLKRERVFSGWNTVGIDGLPNGIYSYQLWDGEVKLGSGKMVKVE